ncbi:hypothetical protein JYT28_00805, partial [Desulfobulbus sp. AH-315-M07]|nr:hypothetical protein [Desulfobulbus sp. AH-315-M07]
VVYAGHDFSAAQIIERMLQLNGRITWLIHPDSLVSDADEDLASYYGTLDQLADAWRAAQDAKP